MYENSKILFVSQGVIAPGVSVSCVQITQKNNKKYANNLSFIKSRVTKSPRALQIVALLTLPCSSVFTQR